MRGEFAVSRDWGEAWVDGGLDAPGEAAIGEFAADVHEPAGIWLGRGRGAPANRSSLLFDARRELELPWRGGPSALRTEKRREERERGPGHWRFVPVK